jgi:hypothetical protein
MSCLEENVTSKGRPNAEIETDLFTLSALVGCAAVFDLLLFGSGSARRNSSVSL